MTLRVLTCRGTEVADWCDAVAGLRIEVFRQFPYLYDGDAGYEKRYLTTYAQSANSLLVVALAGDHVVGASTGLPLSEAASAFREPFSDQGIALDDVFYCGESLVIPAFRGQGLGHRFFDERERHARTLGKKWSAFVSVDRAEDDPRRPPDYRSNEPFWQRRGYAPQHHMKVRLPWKQVGEARETEQTLTMWLHALEVDS
ncbi:GNAT family N-acetyltransferase [Dyella sp. A6]|uniref:GNAT family N-acetyltransferase n=1 Tax=Dyella aluminiiresistens TaxID=3069105 RepID=UPI002E77ACAF|nr:GNAT family N-acetyltransferase [Dyella sp. A6]